MKPSDFQKNAAYRDKLQTLLSDPVFQLAVSVVKDAHEPTVDDTTNVNPVVAAAKYQQRAGVNAFLDSLQKLTEPAKERPKVTTRELIKSRDQL